jgi:hypothetical protein
VSNQFSLLSKRKVADGCRMEELSRSNITTSSLDSTLFLEVNEGMRVYPLFQVGHN